ncbi:hypothetical protein B0H19DRAFT_1076446 [Mycena capillaripes]|nr:hypothetical protein B0H19DRAFT_1076446 [Mycena capillaripes]
MPLRALVLNFHSSIPTFPGAYQEYPSRRVKSNVNKTVKFPISRCASRPRYLQIANAPDIEPPNNRVYPPGPGYIFLTVGETTSVGAPVMVGSGTSPPVPHQRLEFEAVKQVGPSGTCCGTLDKLPTHPASFRPGSIY